MLESRFTSTTAKLLCHHDRFEEWRRGYFRPISLQLAPTDRCNLKCSFCSVALRKGDELSIDGIHSCLVRLVALGLEAVEITGGGDPTCYDQLPRLLEIAYSLKLEAGLITNGILLTKAIPRPLMERLAWIRISLNSLEYVNHIDVPEGLACLGASYVVNEKTTPAIAEKIKVILSEQRFAYLRIVPNCLSERTVASSLETAERLGLAGLPGAFYQSKSRKVPDACRIGYLKPFLAPDGFFYHCSANPLIDRKFNPLFRIGHMNDVDRIWNVSGVPIRPFDTKVCQAGKCFFCEQNDVLGLIVEPPAHPAFL